MANIKSQKKRNRQNVTRYARNKSFRSELKTREKHVIEAAEAGDAAKTEELLRDAQKRIDMATSKGILHANTAARRKSRLTRRVRSTLS
jgi:small subunit ribosomal protein S20